MKRNFLRVRPFLVVVLLSGLTSGLLDVTEPSPQTDARSKSDANSPIQGNVAPKQTQGPVNGKFKPLSNAGASAEARELYGYLCGQEGNGILAGQQESTWVRGNPEDEMEYIQEHTGKLPAIRGLDYIAYNGVTERSIQWWNRGGIVSICWHWGAPSKGMGYRASKLEIDVEQALTPGTQLNRILIADLDRTAEELLKLKEARVPVLWRPYHELNGHWFWWSKAGPDALKRLWKLMYQRYTQKFELDNLIWVFGFTSTIDAKWYPGDEFVDIIGADTYDPGPHAEMYQSLKQEFGNRVLTCLHECGPIPAPTELQKGTTNWSWFLTWHTKHIKSQNTIEAIREIYNHPYVITLDELPAFSKH
ncbi:glycosyl hydrolase [Novipirellula herctigrandis]